jgi:hypothetical protein
VRPLAGRRVDIHARDASARESVGEKSLDLLRSQSTISERLPAAASTLCTQWFLMRAVVTQQSLRRSMQRERDAAVRANRNVTAVVALHERRIAAAIQQQNALFASR